MINLAIKGCLLVLSVAMFRHAFVLYRKQRDAATWHVLQWTVGLVGGSVVAAIGEYALSHGKMTKPLHIGYDAVVNGLILFAIYHGTALTVEWTHPFGKAAKKRSFQRWLGVGGLCMMGGYLPYRLGIQPLWYYAYNGVRLFLFVWFIRFSIVWYHRQAKVTVDALVRYRMRLMEAACIVCLLFPVTVLPQAERYSPRPNLLVALLAGGLFYLGYVTPPWFRRGLQAVSPQRYDESLRQLLVVLSVVSHLYTPRPIGRFLLERWTKRLGRYLSLPERQIHLLVLAGYLLNVGRLEEGMAPCEDASLESDVERRAVHQQSAQFASELLELREIGTVLHHIDERWDGKGVPDGLKGREIPFESRLLSLLETFVEALYFSGDVSLALESVKAETGRFDPYLIDALEEMLSDDGFLPSDGRHRLAGDFPS